MISQCEKLKDNGNPLLKLFKQIEDEEDKEFELNESKKNIQKNTLEIENNLNEQFGDLNENMSLALENQYDNNISEQRWPTQKDIGEK